jgi:hypothetical protein
MLLLGQYIQKLRCHPVKSARNVEIYKKSRSAAWKPLKSLKPLFPIFLVAL